jgi:hypothetical protein
VNLVSSTVFAVALSCASSTPANKGLEFGERISRVVADSKHLSLDDYELMDHPLMKEVIRSPERFRPQVEAYVRLSPPPSRTHIHAAVVSLQCLDLPGYLAFLTNLASAKKGEVSEWALLSAVVPGVEWSTRLAVNYEDPKVRAVLNQVRNSPNASDKTRGAISHILDGTTARYLKENNEKTDVDCSPSRK